MNTKKAYMIPTLRVVATDPCGEILAGSMWTEDNFSRKKHYDEEEDLDELELETTAPKGFWI